jgi:SHS2 domain-containing protein
VFEILQHTADIGFRAVGGNRIELFCSAALALESLALDPSRAQPRLPYPLAVTGDDYESLLVNWLSEVLYYLDARQVVLSRFENEEQTPTAARGQGWGEPRDPERHPARLLIKGVTYHQLKIDKMAEGWRAEVYLDV